MTPEESLNQALSAVMADKLRHIDGAVANAQSQLDRTRSESQAVIANLKEELQKTENNARAMIEVLQQQLQKMQKDAEGSIADKQKTIEDKYHDFQKKTEKELDARRDEAFAALEEKVTKDIRGKVFPLALVIVVLAAGAMIVSGLGAMREVNQSVIELQKQIMGAQTTIKESDAALVKATGEVNTKTADLINTQKQLDRARLEYDELSKAMKALQQKP